MIARCDKVQKNTNNINKIAESELLSEKDYGGVSRRSFNSDSTGSYILHIPGCWNESSPGIIISHEAFTVERKVMTTKDVNIPILKKLPAKELALKWYHPQLYRYEAQLYKNSHPGTRFQYTVMLYAKAAELYEQLVPEFLPLFKEEDRETVKFRMFSHTVGECARQISLILSDDLQKDIKDKKAKFGIKNISQETIDIWNNVSSISDAWITKANHYIRKNQLYRHYNDCAKVKSGKQEKIFYPHPENDPFPDLWEISYPSEHLKEFLKERELALNPPLQSYEKISTKIHPAAMMFARKAQQASGLISSAMGNSLNSQDSERAKLLDKLDGYIPIYTAPKSMRANDIDKDIVQKEKELIDMLSGLEDSEINDLQNNIPQNGAPQIKAPKNIRTLLEATNKGIELLSLVHIRYKTSVVIEDDDTYFFNWFKSASAIDKETYYEIFASYMKNIFKKCLTPLLDDAILTPNVYKVELENAKEAAKSILYCSHDIHNVDSESAKDAVSIFRNIQILCGHENLSPEKNNANSNNGLRHRKTNRIECA